jgi:hypothetical protein
MNRFYFENFSEAPTILDQRKFSSRSSEKPFRKNYIFRKIFIIAEIYFGIIFLHNKFISETYFLSMKSFGKQLINWRLQK